MIVFGQREISRAIESGVEFEELYFCNNVAEDDTKLPCQYQQQISAAQTAAGQAQRSPEYFSVDPATFGRLVYGDRNDGVVGVATTPERSLAALNVAEGSLVLVLQSIEKPGNLGAIFRSADACGVAAILLADPLTSPFHPNAIRASTGVVFTIPTAAASTVQTQTWLSDRGFQVYSAMLENAQPFYSAALVGNTAIVLGNEAKGLTREWSGVGCTPVKLPMQGIADSLNVSVTAAVMLYEAVRQRGTID